MAEKREKGKVFVPSAVVSLSLSISLSPFQAPSLPLSPAAQFIVGGVRLLRSLETDGDWRRIEGKGRRKGAC